MKVATILSTVLALSATGSFGAQYECEDGTIQKRARIAAPNVTAVNIDANKHKGTCFFRINGEPINLGEEPITRSSSGSGSDRSRSAAHGAIEAFRNGRIGFDPKLLGLLLFGSESMPQEFEKAIVVSGVKEALAECVRARLASVRLQKVAGGVACGNTGASPEPIIVDNVRAVTVVPLIYFSVTVNAWQSIVFVQPTK
jgi:hypothetical protein